MFHPLAPAAKAPTAAAVRGTLGSRDAWAEARRWARVSREALSLLSLPLLRPGQGIDGLEVSDSSYEEWVAVQAQFDERVRAGAVHVI